VTALRKRLGGRKAGHAGTDHANLLLADHLCAPVLKAAAAIRREGGARPA